MSDLDAALASIRNAWIAGRSALENAPPTWREVIGDDELALIALTAHATDVLTRQTPGAALVNRPLLPALSAPLMPDAQRARFRRLLATPKNMPSLERGLIGLITARGFAVHPADWMPDAKDDWAPALYAPWLDWVRADAPPQSKQSELTSENYEAWSWSERKQALTDLRGQDPAAARAIIEAKAAIEPAERRVRLIELFAIRLSADDAPFLESLAKDRSDRVRALSRAFLARLGKDTDTTELAAELAAMVEFCKTGIINRRHRLTFHALKTGPQLARRRELLHLVSVAALARALNVEEAQLVESAPDGLYDDVVTFVANVGDTGMDDTVRTLCELLLADPDSPARTVLPLAPRLTDAERRALAPKVISKDADFFESGLHFVGQFLGETPLNAITASPNFGTLKAAVESVATLDDPARTNSIRTLELMLPLIGMLLDAAGARALISQITNWGLSPADPRLDILHFNAALTSENAT